MAVLEAGASALDGTDASGPRGGRISCSDHRRVGSTANRPLPFASIGHAGGRVGMKAGGPPSVAAGIGFRMYASPPDPRPGG